MCRDEIKRRAKENEAAKKAAREGGEKKAGAEAVADAAQASIRV